MPSGRRRGLLLTTAAVVVTLVVTVGAAATMSTPPADQRADREAGSGPADAADVDYRFVSSPDFMNADVADLSGLPGFAPGTPNSWNDAYAQAVDDVMSAFADEQPDDVLVAGDLVNGHWGRDSEGTGVFGPVGTRAQQRTAIRRAAATYYRAWTALFESRDLPVHVAVGDHEIGDNDWRGNPGNDAKRSDVPLFKSELARHALRPEQYTSRPPGPASDTAYATRLHPEVLLVTVDVFELTPDDVVPRLDPAQQTWLDAVLTEARADGVDWIVVQGHVPVLQPVRQTSSSGLYYEGGRTSAFWRTLARHDVDLYLAGEVHDITAIEADGVTQVSHGGLFGHAGRTGRGGTNYLVGDVRGDELTLTSKRFRVVDADGSRRLWQTTGQGRPPVSKTFDPVPEEVGSMRLASDGGVLDRRGTLAPYDPETDPAGVRGRPGRGPTRGR